MISSTLATLECTSQVTIAANRMQSTGSPVMAFMNTRTPGAFSAGASVLSRICSASSIRPSPIKTRPMSLMRERGPLRKATRPMMNSTGATAEMLNDRICTISVVPTLAPSMMASAGTRLTSPSEVNELVISAVAVLLWSRAVRPRPAPKAVKRLLSAFASNRRRSGPNARRIPLWTICRPHSSSATPPIRSRRTRLPMRFSFPPNRVEGSGYRLTRGDQPFNLPKIALRGAAAGAFEDRPSARGPGSVNGVRTQPLHCEPLR